MKGYYKTFLIFVIFFTLVHGRRVQNPCEAGKVPCDNGECIERLDWCGNDYECSDRSDEKYCERQSWFTNPNNNCSEKHFKCDDKMCIPASLRCDKEVDCYDNSDERGCETVVLDEFNSHIAKEPITSSTQRSDISTIATPTTANYYYRRADESSSNNNNNNNRQYSYNPTPSNTDDTYARTTTVDRSYNYGTRYDSRNDRQHYDSRFREENNHRGSDTYPVGNFPSNQQPTSAPEIITQGSSHRPSPTIRSRHDPRRPDYPYAGRQTPVVHPPRSILYPPRTTISLTPRRRTIRAPHYSPFYFSHNYTRDFERKYKSNIRQAANWVLDQRDESYGWGRDTPRGLIALSLISNSFKSDVGDNELMRKSLQRYLGQKILMNSTGVEGISTTRLAVYINALLATCQDPRDFWGIDLAKILYETQHHLLQDQKFINPLIYLSLCLTNMPVPVNYIQHYLQRTFPTEISKDLHILATTAMACVAQQYPQDSHIRNILDEAAYNLLTQMNRADGSFGSKYSTALAAQALMSVNTSLRWDPELTLDYLARQQTDDGSFGDMQATYYTLLALSGRSLVHLRNTQCDPVEINDDDLFFDEGPRKSVFYTLRIGYPETFSAGVQLSVPERMNFFNIMRVAARQDPRFKFSYEVSKGHYSVHTIANMPNDPERGMFWTLYWLPASARNVDLRRRYREGVNELVPNNGDEVIFWYLSEF